MMKIRALLMSTRKREMRASLLRGINPRLGACHRHRERRLL
jgi:hypothetical protein